MPLKTKQAPLVRKEFNEDLRVIARIKPVLPVAPKAEKW